MFLRNSAIQTSEQFISVLFGFIGTIAIARWFGPHSFGVWTLALMVINTATTLTAYGMGVLTVKNCEQQDEAGRDFLVRAISVRLLNVCGLLIALGAGGWLLRDRLAGGASPLLVLLICAPALLLTPLESLEFWFRAGRNAVVPGLVRVAAMVIGTASKLGVIAAGGAVVMMAGAHALQIALPGLLLTGAFLKRGLRIGVRDARPAETFNLYRQAFPLFLSQAAILLALRMDILALWFLRGEQDTGLYSASLRICEALYILPVVLMSAAAPFLFRLHRANVKAFVRVFQVLLTFMNLGSLALAGFVALLAPRLMALAFGSQYEASAGVLAIQVFALVGIAQSVATEYWWIARRRTKLVMIRSFAGAALMLLLSLLLVPGFGPHGAAVAAVLAPPISTLGVHMLAGRRGRHLARLQLLPSLHAMRSLRADLALATHNKG